MLRKSDWEKAMNEYNEVCDQGLKGQYEKEQKTAVGRTEKSMKVRVFVPVLYMHIVDPAGAAWHAAHSLAQHI